MSRLNLTHIILHHTGGEEKNTEQIRRYHLSKGWRDIGYDYIIEKNGQVVQGRSLTTQGAHAGITFYNQHSIGIALIGNLNNREPYPQQLLSLVNLLFNLVQKYQISLNNILLHREIKPTECPGSYFPKETVLIKLKETLQQEAIRDKHPNLHKDLDNILVSFKEEQRKNQLLIERVTRLEKVLEEIQGLILNVTRRDNHGRS